MLSLAPLHLSLLFFLPFIQLVYEAILSSAREIVTLEDQDGNESIDIALVHVAHSRVQHRLKCFDTLVKANPNLVPRLREALQGNESEVVGLNALLQLFVICQLQVHPKFNELSIYSNILEHCHHISHQAKLFAGVSYTDTFMSLGQTRLFYVLFYN